MKLSFLKKSYNKDSNREIDLLNEQKTNKNGFFLIDNFTPKCLRG